MQFRAFLLSLASALHLATAATSASKGGQAPPTAFGLKTRVQPGQPGKSDFGSLYATITGNQQYFPVFQGQNSDTLIFGSTLSQAANGSIPALYHIFYNSTASSYHFTAQMNFTSFPYGFWEPVSFIPSNAPKNTGSIPDFQNGFYFNNTGGSTLLQWHTINFAEQTYANVINWLVCLWVYDVPQLFFTLGFELDVYPSTCAVVDLEVIPIPNAS